MVNVGSNHKSASSVVYRIVRKTLNLFDPFFDRRVGTMRRMNRNSIFRFYETKKSITYKSSCKDEDEVIFSTWSFARLAFPFSLSSVLSIFRTRGHIASYYLHIYFLSFEQRKYRICYAIITLGSFFLHSHTLHKVDANYYYIVNPHYESTFSVLKNTSHIRSCPIIYEY